MNQTQRNYLIDKIKATLKIKKEALESQKIARPSASNYIFRAILNGEIKIQSESAIIEALRKKALSAKEGKNWLSQTDIWSSARENEISLRIEELIILPEDYKLELERVNEHNSKIQEEINRLFIGIETLEMRIQLASDKTLQGMINDVDDMGNLSLMDTKLKALN